MTATIHRCAECRHQSVDHSPGWTGGKPPRVGPCSMGGCFCTLTPEQVEADNPAVVVPTWPGFNHTANRWG